MEAEEAEGAFVRRDIHAKEMQTQRREDECIIIIVHQVCAMTFVFSFSIVVVVGGVSWL